MTSKAHIFWCTGMSGSGKSTLAEYAKIQLERLGFTVLILDGDVVREKYDVQLGFDRKDVEKNNLYIAKLCENVRYNYDAIIVPIISPINTVRSTVRRLLLPNYHLVYIYSDVDTLKNRDTKGLYKKADDGEITDLIGYSKSNPYDIPKDYDFMINTGKKADIVQSKKAFLNFLSSRLFKPSVLL